MLIATTSHHLISPLISFLLVISFSLSFLFLSLLPLFCHVCLCHACPAACQTPHASVAPACPRSYHRSPLHRRYHVTCPHTCTRIPPNAHLCLPLPFPSPAPCYCCPPLHPLSLQLPPLPRCPPTLPPVRASPCAASPCF
jgi:hypothetical protein